MEELTYQEFMAFAKEHYSDGGEFVYETWEEYVFNDYVKMFGSMTRKDALTMFRVCKGNMIW